MPVPHSMMFEATAEICGVVKSKLWLDISFVKMKCYLIFVELITFIDVIYILKCC